MMINDIIDKIKLPFRKEKELYCSLKSVMGFYPHDISYYKLALMHKSAMKRNAKGRPLNNERLEFLGDAILDAIVGDIVFRHFEGKREGFLTSTRSKIVQRDTLNRLAVEIGLSNLIKSDGHTSSHNSYMEGNAFEALVGALYLDRGYGACMRFMQRRVLAQLINIDKVAYKEVNFKSKLLEWCQKNRVRIEYRLVEQKKDKNSPLFVYQVFIEGLEAGKGKGYSKKESQQTASKATLQSLRRKPQFIDAVFAAKAGRTKMEEEPVETVPDIDAPQDFIISSETVKTDAADAGAAVEAVTEAEAGGVDSAGKAVDKPAAVRQPSRRGNRGTAAKGEPGSPDEDGFDLSDIKSLARPMTKEEIIAAAESEAFSE